MRSRLPIIGSALFLLLGTAAYFLPTFVPYLAINGINIVEQKDLIAIGFGGVAAVLLIVSLFTGRKKSNDEDTSDETESATPVANEATDEAGYEVAAYDNTVSEFDDQPRVKLTAVEKRAAKAAAKAEQKRIKEEAKFAKQAAKEAAKAAKAAAKAAKKGGAATGEILDAETGTDWYQDEDFLAQTVTDAPAEEVAEEVLEESPEIATEVAENWTDATYTDPNFTVPFADEVIDTVETANDEVDTIESTETTEDDSASVVALKAKVEALESALAEQAQSTQLAFLELSEATRSNSTARFEWLKDMIEKNQFGEEIVLRMIDMLIRQSKIDEGTVQSALSAADLRK